MSHPLDLQPGERLDALGAGLRVMQRARGHRSGTDDVIAAAMALDAAPRARRVLDLGAGHGTVTLHLSAALPAARFVCVEVQDVSAELLARNIRLNGLQERVAPVRVDLRSLPEELGGFDLVTGTPPFMPRGSGVLPRDPQRAAARFELHGGVEDYCLAAAGRLGEGGVVSILMDASDDPRYRRAFTAAGLTLRTRWIVRPRHGRPPTYLGYVGAPQAPAAERVVELVVRGESGWTDEMTALRRGLGLDP